ncbi:MAG: protein kinase [Myxococcota bacterium]
MSAPVTIGGKYELLRKIATGGMAEVFLARQTGFRGFEKLVVIKRILPHLAQNEAFVKMFLDEARTAADLRHPNVVSVYEIHEDKGTYFISMEFLHGQDVRRILRRASEASEPVPLGHALQIVMDAASGLHYAHAKTDLNGRALDIVHRDISPQNILVTYDGSTKILDFGVAKAASQTFETASGVLKGKYSYMSPEQASGEPVDHRTDQFALGIVAYELTTMKRLFYRNSDVMTLHAVMECEVPPPSSVVSGYPPALERILMKALSRKAHDRFGNCQELVLALEEYLAHQGVVHSPARVGQYMRTLFAATLQHEQLAEPMLEVDPVSGSISNIEEATESLRPKTGSMRIHSAATAQLPKEGSGAGTGPFASPGTGSNSVTSGLSDAAAPTVVDLRRTNLGPELTGFVGRAADLTALKDLFTRGERLVTLLGPGGTGKSRLATHFAYANLEQFTENAGGGAWLCDLTEARDIDGVCNAVGRALDVALVSGTTRGDVVSQLGQSLAARGRVLILLDNFEQVVEHGPATLGVWLKMAPRAHFLVTSRELLRLPGEVPHNLAPLPTPQAGDDVAASEAVQLFVERARTVRRGYALTEAEAPLVAEIVRQLDGIPLAIELAAARMGVLSAAKLLERLPRRFDLLAGTKRDSNARQSTLRGAIDWSWNLLQPWEQSALAQCSVFRGDFTLEAAEEVVDLSAHAEAPWVLDVVQALRDKSLLRTYEPKDFPGELRFGLYVTIREYAAEKLQQMGLAESALAKHGAYFLKVGTDWAGNLRRHGGVEKMRRLAQEQENLMAVHQRAVVAEPPTPQTAQLALGTLLAVDPVLSTRGPFGAHLALLDGAVDSPTFSVAFPALRARVLEARARARVARGRMAEALLDGEQALRLAREAKDRRVEAAVLDVLGKVHDDQGHTEEARPLYERTLEINRELADNWGEARALQRLGSLQHNEAHLNEARVNYEKARDIFRRVGDRRAEGLVLLYLAILEQELGRLSEARKHYELSLTINREVGDRRLEGISQGYLGFLRHEQERLEEAQANYQAAVEVVREVCDQRYEGIFLASLGGVTAALGHVEDASQLLGQAAALLKAVDDPIFLSAVDLHLGHLDLALARRADSAGDRLTAQQYRLQAQARVVAAETPGAPDESHPGGTPSLASQTDESRLALRFLKRALAKDKLAREGQTA